MRKLITTAFFLLIVPVLAVEPIEGDFISMTCRPRMEKTTIFMGSVSRPVKAGERLDIVLKDQGMEISPRENDIALWNLLNTNQVYSFDIVKPGIRTEWGLSGWYEITGIAEGRTHVYEKPKPQKPVDPVPVPPFVFLHGRNPASEFTKPSCYMCYYAFETNFDFFRVRADNELRTKGFALVRDDRSMGPRSVEFRRKDDLVTIYQDMRYRPPRFGEPHGVVGYDEKGWVSLQVVWRPDQAKENKTEPPSASADRGP